MCFCHFLQLILAVVPVHLISSCSCMISTRKQCLGTLQSYGWKYTFRVKLNIQGEIQYPGHSKCSNEETPWTSDILAANAHARVLPIVTVGQMYALPVHNRMDGGLGSAFQSGFWVRVCDMFTCTKWIFIDVWGSSWISISMIPIDRPWIYTGHVD